MNKVTKCPDCGAELDYDSDREFMFCQYCGAKIMVEGHTKHTEHIVNEAEILKEKRKIMELEQQSAKEKSADKAGGYLFSFIFFFFGLAGISIEISEGFVRERIYVLILGSALMIIGTIIFIITRRSK